MKVIYSSIERKVLMIRYDMLNNMTNEELIAVYRNKEGLYNPYETEYAIDKLIHDNEDLIMKLVYKYDTRKIEREDLIDVGRCGLFNAADQFDESYGTAYRTYAWHKVRACIAQEVNRQIGNTSRNYYTALARQVKNAIHVINEERDF